MQHTHAETALDSSTETRNHEVNIRGVGKTVHVVYNILSKSLPK
jgi:hypothetical protein